MLFWMLLIDALIGTVLKLDALRWVLFIFVTLICWYWHSGCVYTTAKKAVKNFLEQSGLDFKNMIGSLTDLLKELDNNGDES